MFEDLIPELADFARELVDAAGRAGLQPRVTSTRRSHSLQKKLYERFLRGESRYPALPPGQSPHEFGYAFDMIVSPEAAIDDVGYTWASWGGIWSPSDAIHFQYPGFVAPEASGVGTNLLSVCDFLSSFTGLGTAQLGDMVAEWIAPLHCDQRTRAIECTVQRLIQGPCSTLLGK